MLFLISYVNSAKFVYHLDFQKVILDDSAAVVSLQNIITINCHLSDNEKWKVE